MLNDRNYPLLKYLRWRGTLSSHPEVRAARGKKSHGTVFGGVHYEADFNAVSRLGRQGVMTGISDMLEAQRILDENWKELSEAFSSKIEYLTPTFMEAMYRSYDTFLSQELFMELEGIPLRGSLILPDGFALCYDFQMKSPTTDPAGGLKYLINGNAVKLRDGKTIEIAALEGKGYMMPTGTVPACTPEVDGLFDFVLVLNLFKKYAQVQTVDARSVRKDTPETPVVDTFRQVDILSCSWYTTIVRKEGFNVRGHFRLQPCGRGRSERKLIYINEFKKNGYIRRARLLTDKNINTGK